MQDLNREPPPIGISKTTENNFQLITKNLHSWIDSRKIVAKMETTEPLKIYWGTATTGKPHLGYFVPIYKIADFLKAGCHVTILFADLHGYLDNMKSDWELLQHRCEYYKLVITEMLKFIGIDTSKLAFVRGSSYQLTEKYTLDMYRLSAHVTTEHTLKAGAEVVKQTENPAMSSLLYPMLQALDEEYLDVDVQFGGIDQRKIFMFARERMPLIGYRKRAYLMNTLIPGLTSSGKMSSSEPNSKIDLDDSDADIKRKIKKSFSIDGRVEGNGLLAILQHIIFPRLEAENREFVIPRQEKYGGPMSFKTFQQVLDSFKLEKEDPNVLFSSDLKNALIIELQALIGHMRYIIEQNKDLLDKAYSLPVKTKKKQSKK